MATAATRQRRLTSVSYHPAYEAADHYRRARTAALAPEFAAQPRLDLKNFGGHTIPALTFTNVYLGTWSTADVQHIAFFHQRFVVPQKLPRLRRFKPRLEKIS